MAGPRGEGSLGILHLARPTMESKDTSPPVSPCGSGGSNPPLRQPTPCLWRFFVRITETAGDVRKFSFVVGRCFSSGVVPARALPQARPYAIRA